MLAVTCGDAATAGAADIVKVLEAFLHTQIPMPGETIHFNPLPAEFPAVSFERPHDSKLLAYWGCVTLFTRLSLDTILQVLCCILMERSVVVICSDLATLSAAMLSLLPLLRPFKWQGMFCPILPSRLHEFLDSPVPLLVGVQGLPSVSLENSYLVYLSLDSDMLQFSDGTSIPPIANQSQLRDRLSVFHERLQRGSTFIGSPRPNDGATLTKDEQHALVDGILTVMKLYYISLLDMLKARAIVSSGQNDDDDDGLTAEIMRKRVASELPEADRPFMHEFLDTQIFNALCAELYHSRGPKH